MASAEWIELNGCIYIKADETIPHIVSVHSLCTIC